MRRFKTGNREQLMLMPPSLNDWIPTNHPARFVLSFVQSLDLSEFYAAYETGKGGQPPYDPGVMLCILLYGQLVNMTSTRKIERQLTDDVGFRFIAGNLKPDHDTISEFRRKHRERLSIVFRAAVQLGLKAQMVSLNHVAIDGTKMRANASKTSRKTKGQLTKEVERIEQLVTQYLDECDRVDEEENKQFGKDKNPYFLPEHLADEEARRKWIEVSLKEMAEAQAASPAEKKLQKKLKKLKSALNELEKLEEEEKKDDPTGRKRRDREKKRGGKQEPKVNTSDFDSRVMKFGDSYRDGYNCQLAVDDLCGLIVGTDVTQEATDRRQLLPTLLQVERNTGWFPDRVSGDNGYLNFEQMADQRFKSVDFYITPSAPMPNENGLSQSESMREKMETPVGQYLYRRRSALVEPVFGMIKHARRFRQFLTKGLSSVRAEWILCCTAHNLQKLYRAGVVLA